MRREVTVVRAIAIGARAVTTNEGSVVQLQGESQELKEEAVPPWVKGLLSDRGS